MKNGLKVPDHNMNQNCSRSPENPIESPIPSLHAWGEADSFVTPETLKINKIQNSNAKIVLQTSRYIKIYKIFKLFRSKTFAEIWGGDTWTHAGKHFVPQSGAAC